MTAVFDQDLMAAPKNDQRDVGLCGAESLGYLGLRHRPSQSSDLSDLFWGQKFLESRNETKVDGVLFVEMVICPFEIGGGAIYLDTVNMVDHRKIGWVRDEGNSNKPMDVDRFTAPISEQVDLRISNFVDAGPEYLSIASLRATGPHSHPVHASHSTKSADLVKITEMDDGNRSPFFRETDIHAAGCPSGNFGTMIKDPSHASTFGGSAIMASASDNYNGRLQFL